MNSESMGYLKKAESRLEAAEELLKSRRYEDSVSRAYYCVLNCARAALALKDSYPRTHEGTLRMFGELYVKGEGWSRTMGSKLLQAEGAQRQGRILFRDRSYKTRRRVESPGGCGFPERDQVKATQTAMRFEPARS